MSVLSCWYPDLRTIGINKLESHHSKNYFQFYDMVILKTFCTLDVSIYCQVYSTHGIMITRPCNILQLFTAVKTIIVS